MFRRILGNRKANESGDTNMPWLVYLIAIGILLLILFAIFRIIFSFMK